MAAPNDTDNTSPGSSEHEINNNVNETQQQSPSEEAPELGKEDREYISGPGLWVVISSVTVVLLLALIDQSILGTAVPQITSDFHTLSDVGWYTGAYQLASASLQPLSGKLYTHFNMKFTFLLFFFIFELGSLICGVATSSTMLIVGRAIAGCGGSGLGNGSFTVIAGTVPLHKRPFYTGIMFGVAQIGIVCGPLIGGALTEYTTWRWCFYINLPTGFLVALALFFVRIPDLTTKPPFSLSLVRKVLPELDILGSFLLVPSIIMLLLALQFGGDKAHAWDSATNIGLFCGAGVLFLVFVAWEWRMGERAMLPGNVIGKRVVWCSAAFGALLVCCVFVASYYLPIYFQAVKGKEETMSGVSLLPSILSQLALSVFSGGAVAKLGYYLPWALGSGIITAIGNGLLSTFKPATSTAKWIGYQITVGAGRGAGLQMSLIATQAFLPAAQIPISIAFLIFTQNLGSSIAIVIATTLFTRRLDSSLADHVPTISAEDVHAAGSEARALRALVRQQVGPGEQYEEVLTGVLSAYSDAISNVFYFLVGLAGVSLVFAGGMGWRDVRKGEGKKEGDEEIAEESKEEAKEEKGEQGEKAEEKKDA